MPKNLLIGGVVIIALVTGLVGGSLLGSLNFGSVKQKTEEEGKGIIAGTHHPCPIEQTPCLGEKVSGSADNPFLVGVGYAGLAEGTGIKAIASGTVEIQNFKTSKGDEVLTITISDSTKKREIIYRFKGVVEAVSTGGTVSEGQVIAHLSDKPLKKQFDKEYNLVLAVLGETGQYLKIDTSEDGVVIPLF